MEISREISPEAVALAKQAVREFKRDGKVTVVCPRCRKHPRVETTPKGERMTVLCECRYVMYGEIYL